jgi:hypothetical protein
LATQPPGPGPRGVTLDQRKCSPFWARTPDPDRPRPKALRRARRRDHLQRRHSGSSRVNTSPPASTRSPSVVAESLASAPTSRSGTPRADVSTSSRRPSPRPRARPAPAADSVYRGSSPQRSTRRPASSPGFPATGSAATASAAGFGRDQVHRGGAGAGRPRFRRRGRARFAGHVSVRPGEGATGRLKYYSGPVEKPERLSERAVGSPLVLWKGEAWTSRRRARRSTVASSHGYWGD